MLSEFEGKPIKALAPAADRWNTDPITDAITLKCHNQLTFLVYQSGGTTGKATLTVLASSDASQTGATAVAFRYRKMTTGASDTLGAVTAATTAGFDTTPNEDSIYEIEVLASELPSGKPWVHLKATEAANDPVNGAVIAILSQPKYGGTTQPAAI
jgi:hypothetical protein